MHLRDRRRRDRPRVEGVVDLVDAPAEPAFDLGDRARAVEGWHAVLQPGEFVGDVGWHQVAPRRQHLSELHEDGTEVLERQAQAFAARCVELAPEAQQPHERDQPARSEGRGGTGNGDFVEPVTPGDECDLREAE